MNAADARILSLVLRDPARKRRLTRRAGIEAAHRRLRGPFHFHVDGTVVIATNEGVEVARLDPFDEGAAHD